MMVMTMMSILTSAISASCSFYSYTPHFPSSFCFLLLPSLYPYCNHPILQYVGTYKEDRRDGQGIYYHKNGDKYDGEWSRGRCHGQGKFTYANGSEYDGEFVDGKMHGQGKYTWPDGGYYEGR